MDVQTVALDRAKARELYQSYKAHQQYGNEIDREIQRTYKLIGQGRVVIQALESVKQAGLNSDGLPNLALGRADLPEIHFKAAEDGSAVMASRYEMSKWRGTKPNSARIEFPSQIVCVSSDEYAAPIRTAANYSAPFTPQTGHRCLPRALGGRMGPSSAPRPLSSAPDRQR